jgi:formylmethanofuran dehydrogenase subunit E
MAKVKDNYEAWEVYEANRERALAERPACDYCERPIQDEYYYYINGENVCEECLRINHKRYVDLEE